MRHKAFLAILVALPVTMVDGLSVLPGRWTRAEEPRKAATKPVPFRLAKPDKPLILLETTVNGKGPYRFVLDTGASLTMISTELAKKIEVHRDESQKAVGAGGSIEVHFGTVKALAIGETRIESLKVGIMDLSGISKAIDTDIDGIVGYNFLSRFRVAIDYPKQAVSFD
jgi:predicted aspartyl protease